jgi:hypothetical protein
MGGFAVVYDEPQNHSRRRQLEVSGGELVDGDTKVKGRRAKA